MKYMELNIIKMIPDIDFLKYESLCSIVTSGYKFPGIPWPGGIEMTKNNLECIQVIILSIYWID